GTFAGSCTRSRRAPARKAGSPLAQNGGVLCQDGSVGGDELDDLELPGKPLAQVPLGMEGSAEIAPSVVVVLDDELAGLESPALCVIHGARTRQPLRGDQHVTTRSEDPLELSNPWKLER